MIIKIFAAIQVFFISYAVWELLHAHFNKDKKQSKFWVRDLIAEIWLFAILLWLIYVNK